MSRRDHDERPETVASSDHATRLVGGELSAEEHAVLYEQYVARQRRDRDQHTATE